MKKFGLRIIKKFKSLSHKKKLLVIVIALVLIISGSNVFNSAKKPEYESARASKGDIIEVVSETGNIAANGRTDVYSPTNGIVTEVFVKNGDVVEEGTVLVTIESSATEQEQRASYANYLTARAALNAAKSSANTLRAAMYTEWDEYRNLATNDTYETGDGEAKKQEREAAEFQIAQDEWLAAEAKYKDQQTVVSQAQAQVSSTWLLYQATQNATIRAPISGVVSNLAVTVDNTLQALSQTIPSQPALTLVRQGTSEVVVALSETDIAKVKEGQKATIKVNSVDDTTYKGVVQRVDDVGTNDQGVIRYNAYIKVLTVDERLRSGMTVDVTIISKELRDVLSVPNAAVKPYKGGRAVRVFDESTREITYIPVKVGVRGKERTRILDGIAEGQEVITALSNEQLQRPGFFGN